MALISAICARRLTPHLPIPEIVVLKIDEDEASVVTCEYVTSSRYVVYNMEPDRLWQSIKKSVR